MKPTFFVFVLSIVICPMAFAAQLYADGKRQTPSVPAATKQACTLSSPFLISTSWRLYSTGFQVLRASGVAVQFKADGKIVSDSIAWLERWQIETDGSLTLRESDGTIAYQFRLDPEPCLLSSLVCEDPTAKVAVLGPKGTDFAGYLKRKCPARFAKHPS